MDYQNTFFSTLCLAATGCAAPGDFSIQYGTQAVQAAVVLKAAIRVQRLDEFSFWNSIALPSAGTIVDPRRNAYIFSGEVQRTRSGQTSLHSATGPVLPMRNGWAMPT